MEQKLKQMCWAIIAISVCAMVAIYVLVTGEHRDFALAIGFSVFSAFLSTSLAVLLFDVWLAADQRKENNRLIENSISESMQRINKIRLGGVQNIHNGFNSAAFRKSALRSKNIKILQTYAPNMQEMSSYLLQFLNNGGEIRLAVVDPESAFARIRAYETIEIHRNDRPPEDDPVEAFIGNLKYSCINRYKQMAEAKSKGVAKLLKYDRSPGVCMYATDEIMFVGPFLSNMDGLNSPMVEIRSNTVLYDIFIEHFENVWSSSQEEIL